MSQVYSTEPQTTGRIILNTTHGPIDINLWCKECPTATRTFLQLCLDGYYNGMIFHRIINNFLIQSGEQRSDQEQSDKQIQRYMSKYTFENEGGAEDRSNIPGSIEFMNRKRLELSPRIRFNHRGQVAMALPLDDDDSVNEDSMSSSLARQFFITLDEAPFLKNKYVVFGTINGDTIFNAMRIGRTETKDEESGELVDIENAPMIKDVRIDSHLFDDLVMTKDDNVPWKNSLKTDANGKAIGDSGMSEVKKRRKKRKGKRDLNVLSFGAEMEDGDDDEDVGMMSSHEVFKKKEKKKKKEQGHSKIGLNDNSEDNIERREKDSAKETTEEDENHHPHKQQHQETLVFQKTSPIIVEIMPKKTDCEQQILQKGSKHVEPKIDRKQPIEEATTKQKISAVEARRLKYLKKKHDTTRKGSKQRDDDTMIKLSAFKSKMFEVAGEGKKKKRTNGVSLAAKLIELEASKRGKLSSSSNMRNSKSSAPAYAGQVLEDDDEYENDPSWMRNTFKCRRHIDHDSKDIAIGGDGRNIDEYEVIDEKSYNRNDSTKRNSRFQSHSHKRRN